MSLKLPFLLTHPAPALDDISIGLGEDYAPVEKVHLSVSLAVCVCVCVCVCV